MSSFAIVIFQAVILQNRVETTGPTIQTDCRVMALLDVYRRISSGAAMIIQRVVPYVDA